MEIIELTKESEKKWNEYLISNNEATFFHQIGWKNSIVNAYGLMPIYLMVQDDNKLKGIFPLFLIEKRRAAISVPFAPYGGPCCDNIEVKEFFLQEIKEILNREKIKYIELRLIHCENFQTKLTNCNYVTSILSLEVGPDYIWSSKATGYERNRIRHAMSSNLQVCFGKNQINDFYQVYTRASRDLGAPGHSMAFFNYLISEFPQNIEILTVRQYDKVIGSMFLLLFRDTIINMWSFSLRKYFNLCPNNLLYWEAVKYGCSKEYRFFDMGRSLKNSGVFKFKNRWSPEVKQLHYRYIVNKNEKIFVYDQLNPRRKIFSSVWRRTPLFLARLIGPKIRKYFP